MPEFIRLGSHYINPSNICSIVTADDGCIVYLNYGRLFFPDRQAQALLDFVDAHSEELKPQARSVHDRRTALLRQKK